MPKHPFSPLISHNSDKLLIGTLPPENVDFYFSHSTNTRLWDILFSINNNINYVSKGCNSMSVNQKNKILKNLGVGISDIILEYNRLKLTTKDKDIEPIKYNNLLEIAYKNDIDVLLFVYKNAYKWFLHSLSDEKPVRITKLKEKYTIGLQNVIPYKGKKIKCIVLPPPLNRGEKGQTLEYKLNYYKSFIRKIN